MYTSKLLEKKEIAKETIEFVFEKPVHFNFTPGQFIQIHIPGFEEEVLRCYSVTTTPTDENIKLVVKIIPGGKGTTYLKNLAVGEEIKFNEPKGHLGFHDNTKKHVFIATGCGIAAIFSIIKDALNKKTGHEIVLLFGLRHEDNIFWTEIFEQWKKEFSNFDFKLTLSQPSEEWPGLRGRVTAHLPADVADTNFYLCGSLPMNKEVREILAERGVERDKVYFEIF